MGRRVFRNDSLDISNYKGYVPQQKKTGPLHYVTIYLSIHFFSEMAKDINLYKTNKNQASSNRNFDPIVIFEYLLVLKSVETFVGENKPKKLSKTIIIDPLITNISISVDKLNEQKTLIRISSHFA